ncbi:PREDICTED: uncharacterized protein LOC104720651 [Camelina sativa]|uniref:Uncharacterized protein LOC104720651 n=1 Tax=Camelina sativa TaxID=90675 RepID=A0ABM0U6U7_CAMSA|nr:PREDICTED: uncharacterized protein LOC104720651 [Camelina sativa]
MEGRSSMGVNSVGLGVNDAENGASGFLTVFGGVNVEERYEPDNRANEPVMENEVFEDREHVDNRIDNEEDNVVDGRHDYVELPCSGETIQKSQKVLEWEDGTGIEIGQEFVSKEVVQDVVNRAANKYCYATKTGKSDPSRITLRCRQFSEGCQWYLRAGKGKNSYCFKVKVYRRMHTCDQSDLSTTDCKKPGTPRLIASVLHEDYPAQLDTPTPKNIMGIVRGRLGMHCSYSTTWRGKKQHVSDVRGSHEKSYTDLHSYLYMLEQVNPGTVTSVEVDKNRFKYLFISLGACIEGFKVMRKVIIMDATFLKSIYDGMLVFATAQDPNHHNYIIAFGVIDKENDASWCWFLRKLKTVVPDEPGLVFMSDRHQSIIKYVEHRNA